MQQLFISVKQMKQVKKKLISLIIIGYLKHMACVKLFHTPFTGTNEMQLQHVSLHKNKEIDSDMLSDTQTVLSFTDKWLMFL